MIFFYFINSFTIACCQFIAIYAPIEAFIIVKTSPIIDKVTQTTAFVWFEEFHAFIPKTSPIICIGNHIIGKSQAIIHIIQSTSEVVAFDF
jgi:hypothetical protein